MGLAGALTGGSFSASGAGASAGASSTPRGGMTSRAAPIQARGEDWLGTPLPSSSGGGAMDWIKDVAAQPSNPGLAGMLGQIMSSYGWQAAFENQMAGLDASRLGLNGQGLDLDRQGIGLTQADIAAQMGFLGRREGLADQLLGTTQAGLGLDEQSVRDSAAIQQRDINNRAAAGGAWFSPETRLDRKDTDSALSNQLSQIGLARKNAKLGREGQQIDFDSARQGLQSDQASTGLDLSRLDLASQNLGIDRQELNARLDDALKQINSNLSLDVLTTYANSMGAGDPGSAMAQQLIDYLLENMGAPSGGTAPAPTASGGGGGSSAPKYM